MLKCESCKQDFEPLAHDQERISEAIANGVKFLVLKCTECNRHTSWKEDIILTKTEDANMGEISAQELVDLLSSNYVTYVNGFEDFVLLKIFEDEEDFKIYSLNRLLEKVNVDGIEYSRIGQIKGYLKTILEFAADDIDDLELLENALSIGFENTRILFIDSRVKNSPLYIFHPDGGDVEKTSFQLRDLL